MRPGEACALRWADVEWDCSAVRVDEALVAALGSTRVRGPKTRASVRAVAVDADTLAELRVLQDHQKMLAVAADAPIEADAFAFSFEPGGQLPPHPDTMSHAFAHLRRQAGVPDDVHLHSLRHFQSTALDPVISEAQKQARLGWATVHMARHYTDAVPEEDRRAAEHVGRILASGAGDAASPIGQGPATGATSA
ncbi:MAG: tyrosine-type recombinase/integrase [Acidimicrobiales bacterium]